MKILVTGGTGFIGQSFIRQRLANGDEVSCLTRFPNKIDSLFEGRVTGFQELPDDKHFEIDAVVNLAGEPIIDKRWSTEQKKIIRDSRIDTTRKLIDWMTNLNHQPEVLVSGSAIGFYGSHSEGKLSEEGAINAGFTHQLCSDWEAEALRAETHGIRVCLIRTGIVLGDGGALKKMLLPFKLGLGGTVATGRQWMSWIHIDDEVEVISMLLTHPQLNGVFNLTAPNAVTNKQFTHSLAAALNRPSCIPMPGFMLKALLGEGAELLLEGQHVVPKKLLDIGYQFKFERIDDAFRDIFEKV